MLAALAAVGRLVTVISAFMIIAVGAVLGWMAGDLVGWQTIYNLQRILGLSLDGRSEAREIFAFVGGIVGFIVAGTIYGLMAAIYDSHRQIRRVAQIAERCEGILRSSKPLDG